MRFHKTTLNHNEDVSVSKLHLQSLCQPPGSPFSTRNRQMCSRASLMNAKEEIEAYGTRQPCDITTQLALCTSTIPSPEESLSPSENGMKLQLSAFLASPNIRVKDAGRRWRALTAAWRGSLYFHRDRVEVRLRCVTLTPVTCDLVKLPEAPARRILIRSQLPPAPVCAT